MYWLYRQLLCFLIFSLASDLIYVKTKGTNELKAVKTEILKNFSFFDEVSFKNKCIETPYICEDIELANLEIVITAFEKEYTINIKTYDVIPGIYTLEILGCRNPRVICLFLANRLILDENCTKDLNILLESILNMKFSIKQYLSLFLGFLEHRIISNLDLSLVISKNKIFLSDKDQSGIVKIYDRNSKQKLILPIDIIQSIYNLENPLNDINQEQQKVNEKNIKILIKALFISCEVNSNIGFSPTSFVIIGCKNEPLTTFLYIDNLYLFIMLCISMVDVYYFRFENCEIMKNAQNIMSMFPSINHLEFVNCYILHNIFYNELFFLNFSLRLTTLILRDTKICYKNPSITKTSDSHSFGEIHDDSSYFFINFNDFILYDCENEKLNNLELEIYENICFDRLKLLKYLKFLNSLILNVLIIDAKIMRDFITTMNYILESLTGLINLEFNIKGGILISSAINIRGLQNLNHLSLKGLIFTFLEIEKEDILWLTLDDVYFFEFKLISISKKIYLRTISSILQVSPNILEIFIKKYSFQKSIVELYMNFGYLSLNLPTVKFDLYVCTKLRISNFNLSHMKAAKEFFRSCKFKSLGYLIIEDSVSVDKLIEIVDITKLKYLECHNCQNILSAKFFENLLFKSSNLESLKIYGKSELSRSNLQALKSFKFLKKLALKGMKIDKRHIDIILKIKNELTFLEQINIDIPQGCLLSII